MEIDKENLEYNLCKICEISKRKYICPRCGIPYCSLKCYQNLEKHIKCSESFYRGCVEDEVRQEQDPVKAKKMEEILHRFHEKYDAEGFGEDEDDSIDSDDEEPLAKRLESVNLDDPDEVWQSLSYGEREDFKRFVHQAQPEQNIPDWVPWWTLRKVVIEEIIEEEASTVPLPPGKKLGSNIMKLCKEQPDIVHSIPPMSSLTKIKPSPSVKQGLANVVAAYVWTARLFAGDFNAPNDQLDVAFALVSLSSFLHADQVFSFFQESIVDVSVTADRFPDLLDGGPNLRSSLHKDVYLILTGGLKESILPFPSTKKLSNSFVLSALSECYNLLFAVVEKSRKLKAENYLRKKNYVSTVITNSSASNSTAAPNSVSLESFSQVFPKNSTHTLDSKVYNKALRKVSYLLAFANEFEIL